MNNPFTLSFGKNRHSLSHVLRRRMKLWRIFRQMPLEDILPEYDQYLEEYVYSKIWSEMSELDKKIVFEMAVSGETKVKNIRERLKMKSEQFCVYRDRMKRKGVVNCEQYEHLTLALPRFDEFVKIHYT